MADEKKVLDQNGLLYYHQGIKQLFVSDVGYDSTYKKFTKTKNGQTTDVVTASTLKTDMDLNNVGNFKAVSTVANQGLTEQEKANARSNIGAGDSAFSGSFEDLTNVPTTVGGYGITDAGIANGVITLGSNTITPLTQNDVISTYSTSGTAPINGTALTAAIATLDASYVGGTGNVITSIRETNGVITATSVPIDDELTESSNNPVSSGCVWTVVNQIDTSKADVSSTLGGYGITDANITNGVITLGSNTFKGVSVAANQGLTTTEQENARANLGITLTEIYKFKGSVATVSALDNIATKAVGDVYNVTANGVNYAWTGTVWDALGGEFEITSITNSEIDTILAT